MVGTDPTPIAQGDSDLARAELTLLFRVERPGLVRMASVMLGDRGDAEEVVQDAFTGMARTWPRSRPDNPAAYLRTSVLNGARSRMRRRAVAARLGVNRRSDSSTTEDVAALRADQRQVLDALDRLPTRQRQCLCLRYYLDLGDAEVAQAIGISLGSAKTHVRRGLAALSRHLEDPR